MSKISEYMTLALTQAARGEAALEAFAITDGSKLDLFYSMMLLTSFLILGVTDLASKLTI